MNGAVKLWMMLDTGLLSKHYIIGPIIEPYGTPKLSSKIIEINVRLETKINLRSCLLINFERKEGP